MAGEQHSVDGGQPGRHVAVMDVLAAGALVDPVGVERGRRLAVVEANRTLPWAVIALVVGTCSVSRWRRRSARVGKSVLRVAGGRPVLGMFLNDPLGVLAEVAGYVAGSPALNRPGFCGGSQSTGEWDDGSSTEVSGRAA